MGREVRMVPKDWQHPKNSSGKYIHLSDSVDFESRFALWKECKEKWDQGIERNVILETWEPIREENKGKNFTENQSGINPETNTMPRWKPEERTHFMMYECVSYGTPISPAFSTAEELAQWLVDNKACWFADKECSYEVWMKIIEHPGNSYGFAIM